MDATRAQYEGGTADPELIAPEGWLLDQHFLDLPGRRQAQLALAYDYKKQHRRLPRLAGVAAQAAATDSDHLGQPRPVLPRTRCPRVPA
ncbi:hypothetical protein GCM10020000_79520 [Streptomyces olivoverticillatus]